jgi:hypothetical protein
MPTAIKLDEKGRFPGEIKGADYGELFRIYEDLGEEVERLEALRERVHSAAKSLMAKKASQTGAKKAGGYSG